MNLQTEKLSLIQKIINSDDEGLIEEINSLISTKDFDWFNGLNKSQQDDVLKGSTIARLPELDSGSLVRFIVTDAESSSAGRDGEKKH